MFSPTPSSTTRSTAWRRSVLDAVDLAVAFATLESYAVPGSTRAERSTPAQAGADRSARTPREPRRREVPTRSVAREPLSGLDRLAGSGDTLTWLERPAVAASPATRRRPGQVRTTQHCTTPLDALARPEPLRPCRGERKAAG